VRKLFLGSIVGVSASLLVAQGVAVYQYVAVAEQDRVITEYERDAFVLGGRVVKHVSIPNHTDPTLTALVARYAAEKNTQVIVVDDKGIAVLSSDEANLPVGSSFASRPEIQSALLGNVASGERWSETNGSELVYVAVPVISGSTVYGAVRLSFPHGEIDTAVANKTQVLWWIAGGSLALAALLSFIVSGLAIRPLRRLEAQANALADGDFSSRLPEKDGPSEIRSVTHSFNAMADKLDTLIRQQRAFASDASHQLRTPLTALLLRIERAREVMLTDPIAADDRLGDVEAEVARLNSIVEGLLAIARSEGGNSTVVAHDLASIARERVDNWRALAEEHNVTIAFDGPESAPCVALETAPEQIIDNLIDNAITHSPDGTSVLVEVHATHDGVTVSVTDSGPGLTLEQCERAFDRFWRADSTREGTGLGLAIVKHLAELSGGSAQLRPRGAATGLVASATFPAR
jgi:signal transduction histidine kinase